jgi:homopolymeric O-antigen transport system permease protein
MGAPVSEDVGGTRKSYGQQAMDKSVGLRGGAAPELIEIRPSRGIGRTLMDFWRHRELLYFLVWKDIKVKYKQTLLGAAWAVLQPLLGMLLFTLLFGQIAKLPSDGIPYPIFYYSALVVWTYFSTALLMASNSVIMDKQLITKVYFPRILLPGGSVLAALLDLMIASLILMGMLIYYQMPLTYGLLLLPGILLLLVIFAFAVGLSLAALNVSYRDVRYALPFLVQLWFFASPIVYPLSMVPKDYSWVVSLNPMVGVIESTRAIVADRAIPWDAVAVSGGATVVLLLIGLWYFNFAERRFADVI